MYPTVSIFTLVLQDLHWLNVGFQVDFNMFHLTYKALSGLGPVYWRDHISHLATLLQLPSAEAFKLAPTWYKRTLLAGPSR